MQENTFCKGKTLFKEGVFFHVEISYIFLVLKSLYLKCI